MISVLALTIPLLCFVIDMAEADSEDTSAIDAANPSNKRDFINGLLTALLRHEPTFVGGPKFPIGRG
jgi:hypothetical protein